jgi:hypothetical protein
MRTVRRRPSVTSWFTAWAETTEMPRFAATASFTASVLPNSMASRRGTPTRCISDSMISRVPDPFSRRMKGSLSS